MAEISISTIDSEKDWESFLSKHPEANFLQSWQWGEFHSAIGHKIHRTGFYNDDELVGTMLSIVEDAKRGRYLTVPGGPIIDWQDTNQIKIFVEEIRRLVKSERCVFVRIRPQLESNEFSKYIFQKNGFISAPTHLHAELTSQIDITKSEDELMANMRKATRYEVRKAVSQRIKVTSTDNPEAIKRFYKLQLMTSERQHFVPFSYNFLYEQFKAFSKAWKVLLYSAEFENKLLAQAFVIFYGQEAAYHYGASTDDGRKYPGAYLIQWEAIKEAKKRGMKKYNLWGVSPENQKDHRFFGLSIFKRGFGGTDFEYLHAQDLVINSLWYLVSSLIEKVRKRLRHV